MRACVRACVRVVLCVRTCVSRVRVAHACRACVLQCVRATVRARVRACLAIFGEEEKLASGGWDRKIKFWNLRSKVRYTAMTATSIVRSLAVFTSSSQEIDGNLPSLDFIWDCTAQLRN